MITFYHWMLRSSGTGRITLLGPDSIDTLSETNANHDEWRITMDINYENIIRQYIKTNTLNNKVHEAFCGCPRAKDLGHLEQICTLSSCQVVFWHSGYFCPTISICWQILIFRLFAFGL